MKTLVLAFFMALCVPISAFARALPEDPIAWLGRMAQTARTLNYSGTFSYHAAGVSETSRVVHLFEQGHELERIEVLDGSPREIIPSHQELRCVFPEERTVIIDQPEARRMFPARLPASFSGLSEHYRLRKGERSRIAGREAQQIVLEPRDAFRYGHQLWADVDTGLLLKARLVDEQGQMIEQFVFNQIEIGGPIDRAWLRASLPKEADWRVIHAKADQIAPEQTGWHLQTPLPGFVPVLATRRTTGILPENRVHLMYSDGLASISVFIEPMDEPAQTPAETLLGRAGSLHLYKHLTKGHRLTVLGEVPMVSLEHIARHLHKEDTP
jgi:sigma-E factor negative regulatory protein RseB